MSQQEAWLAMDARRRAKRRAQWRDSKRRMRMRDGHPPLGYLHALRCDGPHTWASGACRPIPVYRNEADFDIHPVAGSGRPLVASKP